MAVFVEVTISGYAFALEVNAANHCSHGAETTTAAIILAEIAKTGAH